MHSKFYHNAIICYVNLFLLFCSVSAFSQKTFRQGLIVTPKGDTVKGYISYSDREKNFNKIFFKPDSTAPPEVLTPKNISYFKIFTPDKITEYLSYKGVVTNNSINISQLQVGRDTSILVDTIFLKTIEIGRFLTLYSYTDNVKTHFFVREPNAQPQELIYRIYYAREETDSEPRTIDEDTWKKQLYKIALQNQVLDTKLSAVIQHSSYQEEDVVNIISKINGLTKAEALKNNRSRLRPGYIALIAVSSLLIFIELIHEFSLSKS